MENKTVENTVEEKKGNTTNKLLVVVILLLFCFCGYLIWQNLELQKLLEAGDIAYTEVSSERDQVKSELILARIKQKLEELFDIKNPPYLAYFLILS